MSLTQAAVAEAVGISVESFSRIERGQALPSFPTLLRLASLYGEEASDLIKDHGPKQATRKSPRVTRSQPSNLAIEATLSSRDQATACLFLRLVDAARAIDDADLAQLVDNAEALAAVHN